MDELEFRRRAYADPNSEDRDFLQKKNESAENTRLVEELRQLDSNIRKAMHVDVPEGLEQRIKLNQALDTYSHDKKQARRFLSMAASILILISVAVGVSHYQVQNDLSRQLLTHVYDELNHLQDNFNYSIDRTNQVMAPEGVRLTRDIGVVKYVGKCKIGQQEGVHMVLQGERGPVTVMMIPHRRIDTAITIADQRFHGSVEPMEQGSVAIIAEKGEHISQLRRSLQDNLQWL